MQTKAGDRKKIQESSRAKSKSIQNKSVSKKKPAIRTTELDKIMQIALNDPDSITKEEFIMFQSAIGLRQAESLIKEGKNRKKTKKGEQDKQTNKGKSKGLLQRLNITKSDLKENKKENVEPSKQKTKEKENKKVEKRSNQKEEKKSEKKIEQKHEQKTNQKSEQKHEQVKKPESKVSKESITQKVGKVLKASVAPIIGIKESIKSIKNSKEKDKEKEPKPINDSIKVQNKEDISNAPEAEKKAPQEKVEKKDNKAEEAAQGDKKAATNVDKEKQQEKPQDMNLEKAVGTGADKKEQAKTPKAKIKLGEPGDILNQLGSVPPSVAIAAYSDAAAISGTALEKQKQKTQDKLPEIPAPTGLEPKKDKVIKKKPQMAKHSALTSFNSEKSGGKSSEGMPQDLRGGSSGEPNPEEIMAEARQFSSHAPEISMTGEADASQMEEFKSEAAQNVQAAKQAELGQTEHDFGENDIFPSQDNTILKAKHPIKAKGAKIAGIKKTIDIPVEMEGKLNKTLGPELKQQIGEQKNKYQEGKEKFDSDVINARADSDSQIGELKADAKHKQMNEQVEAKAEVHRLRGEWRNEIHSAVSEYDEQSESHTKNKSLEVNRVKNKKDKEIKSTLAKAERDANQEYKSAKKKADDKKKEGEKEKKDKPWYVKAGEWIKDKAEKFVEGLKKAINFIYEGLRKVVKGIFELAKKAITGIIELGRQLIVGIIKGLGVLLKGLVRTLFAKFPGISNKICGLIDKAVNKAVKIVNDTANFLKKGISSVLDFLANTLDKLLGAIQSLYNGIFTLVGMLISGKFAEIMAGIANLGKAAKASLAHIEGAVWKQLVGVDLSKPMGQEAPLIAQAAPNGAESEKLTENDISIDNVEEGFVTPELLKDMNIKDGEVKEIKGSNEPQTVDTIMADFDAGKEAGKAETSLVDGAKLRVDNGAKILDQMKQFVIKWLKDNWVKILLGVLGALAGIIALEIVTGGAITAALPTIITVITNLMNAAAVVSIADTIAQAAGYIETFLSQGWIGKIPVAAVALATAIAMGLVELAMDLGFKAAGAGLKAAGKAVKKGAGAAVKGVKTLAQSAGKSMKSLLKSGGKFASKSGRMIIQNGKIVIKGLQKGFSKGVNRLGGLVDKFLGKFKFKKFKLVRKGMHIRIYGEVNPWVLLYDGTIEKIDSKDIAAKTGKKVKTGDIFEHNGQKAVVVTSRNVETQSVKRLKGLKPDDNIKIHNNAIKNDGKIDFKAAKGAGKASLEQSLVNKILSTPKGQRPDPSTYLSQDYINKHLAQFNDGGSFVMTKKQYEMFVEGKSVIGCPDNSQFVAPKKYMDNIQAAAKGDISVYEKMLGFDTGYFQSGGGLVRFDVKNPSALNLRMPSGNEFGANSHWIPGGFTDGGSAEAIVNLIPNNPGSVTITFMK